MDMGHAAMPHLPADALVRPGLIRGLRATSTSVLAVLSLTIAELKGQVPLSIPADPSASIGVMDGDPRRTFGWISGLAVDEQRELLYVLDGQNMRLSAFRWDGAFVSSTGRRGGGPGEFQLPFAVAIHEDTVFVFDAAHPRVLAYQLAGDSLALVREARPPIASFGGVCQMGGTFYFLGYSSGSLLHARNQDGTVVSFARPFREDHPALAARAPGRVACHEESESVLLVSEEYGILRRYGRTGELVWEAQLPGFRAGTRTVVGRGGIQLGPPREGGRADLVPVAPVVAGGSSAVLVQFGSTAQIPPQGGSLVDIQDVTTVMIDMDSGQVLETFEGVPRIDASGDRVLLSVAHDPFPRVLLFPRTGR